VREVKIISMKREEDMKIRKKSENKSISIPAEPRTPAKVREEEEGYKYGIFWGSWRQHTPSAEYLTGLAKELVKWVIQDEHAYRVEKFLINKCMPKKTYYRWLEKSEDLSDAHDFANMVIAERRESGAIEKRLDPGSALAMMPRLDPEWKEMMQWKASLNKQDVEKTASITVELVDFPSSPLVPVKTGL
jgi:hypothetical protein